MFYLLALLIPCILAASPPGPELPPLAPPHPPRNSRPQSSRTHPTFSHHLNPRVRNEALPPLQSPDAFDDFPEITAPPFIPFSFCSGANSPTSVNANTRDPIPSCRPGHTALVSVYDLFNPCTSITSEVVVCRPNGSPLFPPLNATEQCIRRTVDSQCSSIHFIPALQSCLHRVVRDCSRGIIFYESPAFFPGPFPDVSPDAFASPEESVDPYEPYMETSAMPYPTLDDYPPFNPSSEPFPDPSFDPYPYPEISVEPFPESSFQPFGCNGGTLTISQSVREIVECRPGKTGRVLVLSISSDCRSFSFELAFCRRDVDRIQRPLEDSARCVQERLNPRCETEQEPEGIEECVRSVVRECSKGILAFEDL